jgi:hypothetical protein
VQCSLLAAWDDGYARSLLRRCLFALKALIYFAIFAELVLLAFLIEALM